MRSQHMNEGHDQSDLARRLHAMGERPMAPGTAQRVLARAHMGSVGRYHSTRLKVAAALAAGFAAGSIGLASAGELPAPVQEVAHSALGAVGIGVPPGHDRYNGPECGGTYANHGQYVRAHKGDPNAGRSPCGKPSKAVTGRDEAEAEAAEGQGRPSWANGGNGKGKDREAKAKGAKEKGAADDDGTEAAVPQAPAPGSDVTTTTLATVAPTSPTTGASTTTTTTTAPVTTITTAFGSTSTSTSTPEATTTTTVP